MKQPVDHILRSQLPWRDPSAPAITECGYEASKVKTITREQFAARQKELGEQRCSLFTCMTCAQTVERWETWDEDPRKAVGREVEWEASRWGADRGNQLKDELVALAAIAQAHRAEFESIIQGIRERRDWQERKAAKTPEPKEAKGRRRL